MIEKTRPNAFFGTDLADHVGPAGTGVIVAGFLTHNCVSSTARAALDLGYEATVSADACATRDLPAGDGVITGADLHGAELAALADRHAWVRDVSALVGPTIRQNSAVRTEPPSRIGPRIRGH